MCPVNQFIYMSHVPNLPVHICVACAQFTGTYMCRVCRGLVPAVSHALTSLTPAASPTPASQPAKYRTLSLRCLVSCYVNRIIYFCTTGCSIAIKKNSVALSPQANYTD
jgi:hypothetical protein